jgi:hypothetical protein
MNNTYTPCQESPPAVAPRQSSAASSSTRGRRAESQSSHERSRSAENKDQRRPPGRVQRRSSMNNTYMPREETPLAPLPASVREHTKHHRKFARRASLDSHSELRSYSMPVLPSDDPSQSGLREYVVPMDDDDDRTMHRISGETQSSNEGRNVGRRQSGRTSNGTVEQFRHSRRSQSPSATRKVYQSSEAPRRGRSKSPSAEQQGYKNTDRSRDHRSRSPSNREMFVRRPSDDTSAKRRSSEKLPRRGSHSPSAHRRASDSSESVRRGHPQRALLSSQSVCSSKSSRNRSQSTSVQRAHVGRRGRSKKSFCPKQIIRSFVALLPH